MNTINTLSDLFSLHGTEIDIPLNYRFFIHDENFLYWVDTGNLDIFGLDPHRNQIKYISENFKAIVDKSTAFFGDEYRGGLNFLKNVKDGSLLFGFKTEFSVGKPLIVGIANVETKIRKISIENFIKLVVENPNLNPSVDSQIQNWVEGFSHLFLYRNKPKYLTHIKPGAETNLKENEKAISQKLESEKIVWVEIIEGSIEIAGLKTLTLKKNNDFFPLSLSTWFQAPDPTQLRLLEEHPIISNSKCINGLKQFHSFLIDVIFFNKLHKGRREINKIKMQASWDEKLLEGSIEELGKMFEAETEKFPITDPNRIYRCCQTLGNYLNLKFTPLPFDQSKKIFSKEVYIFDLCKNSRVQYRRVTLMENWWTFNCGPLLCFNTQDNLPLALIPGNDGYLVYNPEDDSTKLFDWELYPYIQPSAYVFYRNLPLKDEISTSEVVSFSLFKKKIGCIAFAFFAFLSIFVTSFIPTFTQKLYGVVVPNLDYVMFIEIGIAFVLVSISIMIFAFCREYLVVGLSTLFDHDLSAAFMQRILSLPITFFRRNKLGDLFVRMQIVPRLRTIFSGNTIRQLITAIFSLVYLVPMFYYNSSLAWIGLSIIIPTLLVLIVVLWKSGQLNQTLIQQSGELNSKVLETLFGINTIRTYGCENRFFSRWEKIFFRNKQTEWKANFLKNIVKVIYAIANPISMTIIFAYMIYVVVAQSEMPASSSNPVQGGMIAVAQFMGFYMAYTSFFSAILASSDSFLQLSQLPAAWRLSKIFLDEHPESSLSRVKPGKITGELRVDHLSFRYEKEGNLILDDVSIKVKPGEMIAIVGHSGCGKSTLIRNLIGFEIPEEGGVYFDGRDLATLDLDELRSQLGIVLQNSSILDGTLRENVMAGSLYSDKQVLRALTLAGFEKDLASLPMGLETLFMNGGTTLSGGQKQKILIARALIGNPKMLIFDEASSALDNETQQLVIKNLDALNTTRIVIAHRLSTIINADRIYVMDLGKIVDEGTYKELSERDGIFKNLLKRQSNEKIKG